MSSIRTSTVGSLSLIATLIRSSAKRLICELRVIHATHSRTGTCSLQRKLYYSLHTHVLHTKQHCSIMARISKNWHADGLVFRLRSVCLLITVYSQLAIRVISACNNHWWRHLVHQLLLTPCSAMAWRLQWQNGSLLTILQINRLTSCQFLALTSLCHNMFICWFMNEGGNWTAVVWFLFISLLQRTYKYF